MRGITRREFLERFFRGRRKEGEDKGSKGNKDFKVITRREFLKGLIAFLIGLFLLREEKRLKQKKKLNGKVLERSI
jgi:hypothetical protein